MSQVMRRTAAAGRSQDARSSWGGMVGRRSKYRAVRETVDGFTFASKAEARRYRELCLLGQAGEICNLELQPRFPITVNGQRVADYVADFRYQRVVGSNTFDGRPVLLDVVEDVKGLPTPLYRLKKKLVEAQHGIQIVEVR